MVSGKADLLEGQELAADINHGDDTIRRGAAHMSAAAVDSPDIEGHRPDQVKRLEEIIVREQEFGCGPGTG